MKVGKKIVALCLGATLALGSAFGLAACKGDTGSTGDPNIRLVYDMYVENCAAKGEEALTYEDWLAAIKGEDGKDGKDGKDGVTPHIGENGNWYIGNEDTKIKAEGTDGSDGITPHIDTESGHWFIGDEDTGIPATGAKGDNGENGSNGASFLHGKGKPDATLGNVGDLYLDLNDYNLYEKTAEGWSTDPVGNIKGEKGDKGDKGDSSTGGETEPAETVIKEYKDVTINASGNYQLDLTEVESGHYWLVADTQTTAAAGILSAESTVSYKMASRTLTATASYDLYSSKKARFRGIVVVDTDSTKKKVTVYNNSAENITADLKLVEYTSETLVVGQEFEIPCLSASMTNSTAGYVPALFDKNTLSGKQVKITLKYAPSTLQDPCLRYNSEAGQKPTNIDQDAWPSSDLQDGVWSHTFTMPANAVELFLLTTSSSVKVGFNAVVKIELAETSSDAVKTWDNVTINANGTYELDVTGVAEGHYWLVAKTETAAAVNILTESYTIETNAYPYDMYSSLTNSFKGFAYISSTATSITLTNKSAANISGDFKLVEYTPVAITTDQEVEIPVPLNGSIAQGNIASYTFDNSLVGKSVKFSFPYLIENGVPLSRYIKTDESNGSINPAWKESNGDKVDGIWSATRTIPEDALRLAFTVKSSTAGCNAVVKIELAP